jgi:hypothetical protein
MPGLASFDAPLEMDPDAEIARLPGGRQKALTDARKLLRTFASAPDARRRAQEVIAALNQAGGWNAAAQREIDATDAWLRTAPLLWRSMFLPQAMPEYFASGFPFNLPARPIQTEANGEDSLQMIPGLAQ